MFQKIKNFLQSKLFLALFSLSVLFITSVFFCFWGSLIAFNDVYIFANPYLRFGIVFVLWFFIFLFFLLKPIINFFASFKNEKRSKLKALKKEANEFLFKAKRNFFISMKDAKNTWKQDIKTKNLPLIIIIGNEGAGKSTFINYSNIEYPLSDSLESYKKLHKSTTNFSLYVSKNGALLDTEGNYFSQEEFFSPQSSDELPEDDIDKNKEFLVKKHIWRSFLNFLNKNFFHSKLNGIVLIVDTKLFLTQPKEYSQNIIRYLTKRVNDCENALNLRLPIYIVFSKLDLLEGMKEFMNIFNEKIANKILGLSFSGTIDKNILDKDFKEISQSLFYAFTSMNHHIHSLEEKNKIYFFLKQLDNLFALAKNFILQLQNENSLKNNSSLRGMYFVSAYQENVPRNFLLDAVCEKYNIKKALVKTSRIKTEQSFFVKSLLEDIIFKDTPLSHVKNLLKKISFVSLAILLFLGTYFISFHFISKNINEQEKAHNALYNLNALLQNSKNYENFDINKKVELLAHLKNILSVYPQLGNEANFVDYFKIELSYKAFSKAQEFYYQLNEDVLKNTLLKEMEFILQNDNDSSTLVKTLYMYKSLFAQQYLDKNLLKIWINENWQVLSKYQISNESFLSGIDELTKINLNHFKENEQSIRTSIFKLGKTSRAERIYILLDFINYEKKRKKYNLKDDLGFAANSVFAPSSKIDLIERIYTKNGMLEFLNSLNTDIDKATQIEAFMFANKNLKTEDKNALAMAILKIYLDAYQNKWQSILHSLAPQKYNTKDGFLNELSILSKKENPVQTLLTIINSNTNLNDPLLLTQAYNLGLNASEIKNSFVNFTKVFEPYHQLNSQNKLVDAGTSALGLKTEDKNEVKLLELLSADIMRIHTKITEFTTTNTQSAEEKIIYALGKSKDTNDAFTLFNADIKKLPGGFEKYYKQLSLDAWNLIENHGISLFNTAWFDEVYTPFINNIALLYPFNETSSEELSIDAFKSFFGKNGTLNRFLNKYFNGVLIKRKNSYSVKNELSSKMNFSKDFLNFISTANVLSNLMLNANDNIKVSYTLKSLDLSADFSFIEFGYNNLSTKYDHTLNTNLAIIAEHFNHSSNLNFTAYNYANSNLSYQKNYKGEWAWYRFANENKKANNYGFIFENNTKMYFDFALIGDIHTIITTLKSLKITENVTGNAK